MTQILFNIPTSNSLAPVVAYPPANLSGVSVQEVGSLIEYENVKIVTEQEAEGSGSYFGTPVFGKFEFIGFDPEDGEAGVDDLVLEVAVIDVTLAKNIHKTRIAGRSGTVKETIGADDYQLTLKGVVFSPEGELKKPWNQIQQLDAFANHKKSVQVNHRLLYRLGVFDVVIESFKLIPTDYVNAQRFEMQMSSDREFELKINPA